MPPDDAALLNRWIRLRDTEAFNEIVDRFADQVYSTCRRILRNEADAEEVSQECFLALARSSGEVRSSLGGWLHRVATYKSPDRIPRDMRRREPERAYGETAIPVDLVDIVIAIGDGTGSWESGEIQLEGDAITNLGAISVEQWS